VFRFGLRNTQHVIMPFVYIVECADGSLYTGWAMDVEKRVEAHNAGRGARYTRMNGPVRLVYCEECESRAVAQKLELAIKKLPRAKKLELINVKRKT
jgi:putative endonuclease